jgi:hypothetical protein
MNDLPDLWRKRAADLDPYSPPAAEAFRRAAEEFEADLKAWWHALLDLQDALAESGYSRDSLLRFIREGQLENIGSASDPRVRRRDLPCKPGHKRRMPWDPPAPEKRTGRRGRRTSARIAAALEAIGQR